MAMAITLPHIPFDLVEQVLCRLSVKHLTQLRCVCKSWNTLISEDSKFAKKQLRLSISHQDRHHLIRIPTQCPKELILSHSPISSIFSLATTTSVKQFSYSLGEILNKGGASTCDGIICFKTDEDLAVLCNPSIRKFKKLPPLKFRDQSDDIISYTLVHDRFTSNYKVIAVKCSCDCKIVELNIHTLGIDYWRRIQEFPTPFYLPTPGIFVNDSVNWLAYDGSCYVPFIVSFDLEKESYQILLLPVNVQQFQTFIIFMLGTLRGCLSLFFNRSDGFSDVWIMKEYGNENSWMKLLSVPQCNFGLYSKALYVSEDDQVLMECLKMEKISFVVYDFINNTFKIPKFPNNIHGSEMTTQVEGGVMSFISGVYIESLTSPL